MKRKIELPASIKKELNIPDDAVRKHTTKKRIVNQFKVRHSKVEDDDRYGSLLGIKKGKLSNEFIQDGLADLLDYNGNLDEHSAEHSTDDEISHIDESKKRFRDMDALRNRSTDNESKKTEIKQVKKQSLEIPKYVPPQARIQETLDLQLMRAAKGLLNRLSDANMESILSQIHDLYRQNARRDVTVTIVTLLLDMTSNSSHLNDSYLLTFAALIAALYHSVGLDFGSSLIEAAIKKLSKGLKDGIQDKARGNITTLLGYLYSFGVISCVLVYDLIKQSLSTLEEIDVEILLRLLKICGVQIRADDPSALKEIIIMMNEEIGKKDPKEISTRLKFMSESIMDLKNNKTKKRNQDKNDQVIRLKKFVLNYVSKNGFSSVEPLRICIKDISAIEEKGRWWLVGSAWAGVENVGENVPKIPESGNQKLLALAKAQKMNTDVRKAIFVIIMSSEDFIDAYERLQKLGLKDKQEREIVRVILHCCLQERIYNPFYAYLAQRFCEYGYSFKITFQYALWDIFKSVDNEDDLFHDRDGVRRISNLGRLFLHLVVQRAIPISILKSLTFTSLSKLNALFCQIVVGGVLCHCSSKSQKLVKEIFMRMKELSNDAKEGLLFFMKQYLSEDSLETILKPIPKTNVSLLSTQMPIARTILEGGKVL